MNIMDKAKQAALIAAVKTGLGYLEKDPEVNIPKLMELIDRVCLILSARSISREKLSCW